LNIKGEFIKRLVDELNDENERGNHNRPLNICYMTSVVDQQLEKCSEFIEDITIHRYEINGYEYDNTEGYTNGKMRVLIEKPDEEKNSEMMYDAYYDYCYYIEFGYDERHWGYCDCNPGHKGFNEKHGCCGNGCDWTAPQFYLTKSVSMGGGRWDGVESDYWSYEEKFNNDEKNKNTYVEEMKKKAEIKRLETSIKDAQDRLKELQ
jgi:hypothetical protein